MGIAVDHDALFDISVRDGVSGTTTVIRRGLRVPATADLPADSELSNVLRLVDPDEAAVVSVDLSIPGVVLHEGVPHRVERLFMVSVDAWASGAGTVTLHTFGDAWMSHDLRGYRQPGVQEENAPRLASALTGITRLLDAEVVPGDTTSFGVPSEDGFDDLPDEDPDLLDSWYMFEVPRRTDRLLEQLPDGAPQFDNVTESPVNFQEVASDGTTIGYLWASASDDAAGYEPRTPMGQAALDAAVEWLGRLSEAKARGLSPTRALRELTSSRADSRGGAVTPGSLRTADSLEDLQDLSGRE
ncbi:hypothetical protein ACFYZ9_07130 [Streptomyces sp. NPDC001691]|uniref:hypothetical protein n=1 Tax=Streptomyces sp. NPDC001691 TaxID=3364600 RepID=UPI0036C0F578